MGSSMEEEDMAEYTLSLVKQIITHRGNLLKKTQEVGHVSFNLGIEQKLDDLAKHTLSMASQARARTSSRCRSELARSVSRGRSMVRISENKRMSRNILFDNQMKRKEERMARGYF